MGRGGGGDFIYNESESDEGSSNASRTELTEVIGITLG